MDIDTLWEYSDPALSEERFRQALGSASGDERLELLTQIARSYSLRGRFDEAHRLLDEMEGELAAAGARPRVCWVLERGRCFNSAGDEGMARLLFVDAWDQARAAGLEGLAVDAAHMLAVTYAGSPEAIVWNQRGLAIACGSHDNKAHALIPPMLNNTAWDLHELGRFDEALDLFREAQTEWLARGKLGPIRVATWAVARCLRSLRRYDEALGILDALEAEHAAAGSVDGYVFEEIVEDLAALGRTGEAKPYFGKAADALGKNEWFVKHEAGRLARLKERGER